MGISAVKESALRLRSKFILRYVSSPNIHWDGYGSSAKSAGSGNYGSGRGTLRLGPNANLIASLQSLVRFPFASNSGTAVVDGGRLLLANPGDSLAPGDSVIFDGADLVVSDTDGLPNGSFSVFSSTNLALPLRNWPLAMSVSFNSLAEFGFTNLVDKAGQQ